MWLLELKLLVLGKQQQCSRWPHYVSLSVHLLINHQGKHFQAWRMQAAGSCTARRFPLEDSLLNSYSRKECISGICMLAAAGIYYNLHYNWRLNQSHFCLRRMPRTPLQQYMWMCSKPFILNCVRPPGPLSLYRCVLTGWVLVAHCSTRQREENKAVS